MPGLRVFLSNRLESLSDKLAEVLSMPLSMPLDKEIIVVQNRGMERWLSLRLAEIHGICANYEFPFPNSFLNRIFGLLVPEYTYSEMFEPDTMTWEIIGLLPKVIDMDAFGSVKAYLADDIQGLKMYQLARHIADRFDQYMVYRPEMILDWEKGLTHLGEEERDVETWQAILFRNMLKDTGGMSRVSLLRLFMERVEKFQEHRSLPERVSIFGISSLPRYHMEALMALSSQVEVNLFLMSPAKEFWGDIVSDMEMVRLKRKEARSAKELFLEKGNTLLASMGIVGRDFLDLVYGYDLEEFRLFEDVEEESLLSCVQSDILNLRESNEQKRPVSKDDRSIQVHSCHSPMREIEVLFDNLLEMFDEDPGLEPRDILVMAPDIEKYVPYIQAVFGTPEDDSLYIPYSIADRPIKMQSQLLGSFFDILDLPRSRLKASDVLNLLEFPCIRRRFNIQDADLDIIRKWVRASGIRWGLDADFRMALGLPGFEENTWSYGIKRLLLGYAMPGEEKNLYNDILPYDNVEGEDGLLLGRFIDFTNSLFSTVKHLDHPRSLKAWSDTLVSILDDFFESDEDTLSDMQLLRSTIYELGERGVNASFNEEIGLEAIKACLGDYLNRREYASPFITGGVVFCAMLPMRSIPFKVICLIGMDVESYPRISRPPGFDLISRHPMPLDRSTRDDDKYLFLEAIVSARKRLYISYVGQSMKDNTITPPSVLVSALMDYVDACFTLPDEGEPSKHMTVEHRLQAFSPEYFSNKKLFSYSKANLEAAKRVLEQREEMKPFFTGKLKKPGEEWRSTSPYLLDRFFTNPARFIVKRKLGIDLGRKETVLEEQEPFVLGGLEQYNAGQYVLNRLMEGVQPARLYPLMRASGMLPHGNVGHYVYKQIETRAKRLINIARMLSLKIPYEYQRVELEIDGFRIEGQVGPVSENGVFISRYAKVRPSDHVCLWINHLIYSLANGENGVKSYILGRDEMWEYGPIDDPHTQLGLLLKFYWEGLSDVLHFFPKSSWEFARSLRKGESETKALANARKKWEGNDYELGDRHDPYIGLCFPSIIPLDDNFKEVTKEIMFPIMEAGKKYGD